MIGILFFLFEFFDDQLLAFLVLTLVWLCELFTMIRYCFKPLASDRPVSGLSKTFTGHS